MVIKLSTNNTSYKNCGNRTILFIAPDIEYENLSKFSSSQKCILRLQLNKIRSVLSQSPYKKCALS